MTPFAIAGIQMRISASQENISAMAHRLDILMARFPWVQMVVFSELAAFGPLPGHAQTLPGPGGRCIQGDGGKTPDLAASRVHVRSGG